MANNTVFEGSIDGFARLDILHRAFLAGHVANYIRKPEGFRGNYAAWYAAVGRSYNNQADWLGLPLVKISDWLAKAS